MFIFPQSRYFSFMNIKIEVVFPICTLKWRKNNYVSRQAKGMNRRNKVTDFVI